MKEKFAGFYQSVDLLAIPSTYQIIIFSKNDTIGAQSKC